MIINAIISLALNITNGIVNILPVSSGFPPAVLQAASTFAGYFGLFSPLIPLGTLLIAVTLVFVVEIAIFGWKTVKSLVSHVPQFGGAGH